MTNSQQTGHMFNQINKCSSGILLLVYYYFDNYYSVSLLLEFLQISFHMSNNLYKYLPPRSVTLRSFSWALIRYQTVVVLITNLIDISVSFIIYDKQQVVWYGIIPLGIMSDYVYYIVSIKTGLNRRSISVWFLFLAKPKFEPMKWAWSFSFFFGEISNFMFGSNILFVKRRKRSPEKCSIKIKLQIPLKCYRVQFCSKWFK